MDYKEKYEKALDLAKSYYDKDTNEFLDTIFPELAESEDERIRKIITESVFYQYGAGVEYKDVLDYLDKLEKQKENKFAPRVLPCSAAWFEDGEEKQKEQKPNELFKKGYREGHQLGYEKGYNDGQKEQKHYWKPTETDVALFNKAVTTNKTLTPTERAQLDIIRSKFGCCRATNCSGIVQKEQKPNIEICPHSIKSKSYSENGYPIENCDYGLEIALTILQKTYGEVEGYQTDDGIREHQTAIQAVKDAMKEQKPLTTEETELNSVAFLTEMWYTCIPPSKDGMIEKKIDALMKEQKPVDELAIIKKYITEDVISSEVNDRLVKCGWKVVEEGEQKTSWSEEDEHCLELLDTIIDSSALIPKNRKKCHSFLKSLRPQPHWKPSEEQMEALERTIRLANFGAEENRRKALESLHEQLRKLT